MTALKRFGWTIPATALAVGAFVLAPSTTFSAGLPAPTATAAAAQSTDTEVVNGSDWHAMATPLTLSVSVKKPGVGAAPGTVIFGQ